MDLAGRVMPYSTEAEQSVLGSILIDSNCIASVSEIAQPDDFYFEHNKTIYNIMLDLFNTNTPIDMVTVSDALKAKGVLDSIGGVSYLATMAQSVPTTANIEKYAKIISEKAVLRRIIKAGGEIADIGYDMQDDSSAALEESERILFDVLQGRESKGMIPVREIVGPTFEMMQNMVKQQGKVTGVPTGFEYLDRATSGLQKSDLIIIAARPAMGKTSFALNIAQHAAIRAGVPTAIFNLEMSREQLTSRIICSEAMVGNDQLKSGKVSEDDWIRIGQNMAEISKSPMFIDDTSSVGVSQIRAKCRRLKQQHNLGLVVIDYLQLMESGSGSGKNENRQQEISAISRSLKILAKELNIPIIVLSQLGRGPEGRTNKRPMLSDLRESGAIEQDADIVMFLYRDEYYNPDTQDKNIAECIIAKHRNGETGKIKLWWDGPHTKFLHRDLTHEDEFDN